MYYIGQVVTKGTIALTNNVNNSDLLNLSTNNEAHSNFSHEL